MLFNLQGKVAVITGAASGIGRAIAIKLAAQGAQVQVLDLNESAAKAVADEIKSQNFLAQAHACNVAKQAEVKAVAQKIADQHAHIDILVNSAGIAHIGKLETTTEADFDRLFQVNVKGV